MFTVASRYSFKSQDAEKHGNQMYEKGMAMWSAAGAHSMQRFRILEGPYKDQQMVVVRFPDQQAWQKAADANKDKRQQLLEELEQGGVHREEMLLLDEVHPA